MPRSDIQPLGRVNQASEGKQKLARGKGVKDELGSSRRGNSICFKKGGTWKREYYVTYKKGMSRDRLGESYKVRGVFGSK